MSIKKTIHVIVSVITPVITGLLLAGLGTSCDRTRNDKGYEYFPDMAHSLAYETYSPNKNFKNGVTQQPPPAGTINREIAPYPFPATDSGRALAARSLKNPFEPTQENLEAGKAKYEVFCMNCHGEKGDGKGWLFVSKRYAVPPSSYLSDKVMKMPEGEIYHVITSGFNTMGAHGSLVRPDDRWKIILYVQKVLQQKP
ncbi:MAG: cytochrome c [Bacteroidales bacterium]